MIRAALVSIVFLGFTLALILMQPGVDQMTETDHMDAQSIVTRAQTEYNTLDLSVPNYQSRTALAESQPVYETISTANAKAPQVQPAKNTLALQPETAAITPDRTPLEQLIIEAVQEGRSEAYILELVKRATKQDIQEDGLTRGTASHTNAFLSLLDRKEGFASPTLTGTQTYVVQPGDSLASISKLFYNDTRGASNIFNTNRSMMGSPDNIVVGQELVIPVR